MTQDVFISAVSGERQDPEPRRRRRPALSCIECRRKKVACDRHQPCRRCISAGLRCAYKRNTDMQVEQHEPQARDAAFDAASDSHFAAVETSTRSQAMEQHTTNSIADAIANSESLSIERFRTIEQHLRDLLNRVQELEGFTSNSLIAPTDRSNKSGLCDDLHLTVDHESVAHSSHWMATPPEFEQLISFCKKASLFKQLLSQDNGTFSPDPDLKALVTETAEILHKCKVLARDLKVKKSNKDIYSAHVCAIPPDQAVSDRMAEKYFRCFESAYRILHEPSFWIEYNRYWEDPTSAPIALRLQVLLVVALGSSVSRGENEEAIRRSTVYEWIDFGQTWLTAALDKHQLDVRYIQVHCLTILARQIYGFGGDLIWASMGSLVQTAMQINLHRDPRYLSGLTILQSEIRRRLWATILELVVQSSLDSEKPPRISFDDFDSEPLSNVDDNEISQSITDLQSRPMEHYTRGSIQLTLLDSWSTRFRIVQLMNGLSSQISYEEVLKLSRDLTDSFGRWNIVEVTNEDEALFAFHRNFADFLVRRFFLYLHLPFSCRASSNPLFHYSRKVALDAAMAIISPVEDEAFTHLQSSSGNLFKHTIRYSSVAISIELLAQTNVQRRDGTLYRSAEYRALLKRAMERLISLSTDRIRNGETNVKHHTFLSMVLAEVESIEERTSCELEIARSARDSLQLCYHILQTQLGSEPTSAYNGTDLGNLDGEMAFAFDFDMGDFLQDGVFF